MAKHIFIYNGIQYRSKKFPILEYIFNKYNPSHEVLDIIEFTLEDISEGYKMCGIKEPASISNTILDLTRKDNGIESRVPESIYKLGYDLRKRTGENEQGRNRAGQFVYVGVGNSLKSWFKWPLEYGEEYIINPNSIPSHLLKFIRNDEGALLSVMDYCDILSKVLENHVCGSVLRVQHPLKFQPNEIDGFYMGHFPDHDVLYPVEAKALTTGDDINLEQMQGAIDMLHKKFKDYNVYLQPIAARMIENGIQFALFQKLKAGSPSFLLECVKTIKIKFDPVLNIWKK